MLASTEEVFTDIYRSNHWGGTESVSGPGSDCHQTRVIRGALPKLLRDFGIATMLDIPCGDFQWMSRVDLKGIDYTGADIVEDLVRRNREHYGGDRRRFEHLNLLRDPLPKVDLIFCRDCLVHFSFDDIFAALRNIRDSRSQLLLTTTFARRTANEDIATGQWHGINLRIAPFELPPPLAIINEGCTESRGRHGDKSLALWRINDVGQCLTGRTP